VYKLKTLELYRHKEEVGTLVAPEGTPDDIVLNTATHLRRLMALGGPGMIVVPPADWGLIRQPC
jgi:hypothetical protein